MEEFPGATFIPVPAPEAYSNASGDLGNVSQSSRDKYHEDRLHESSLLEELRREEAIEADGGGDDDEYTLIPLGNDTFQVFKTSDLILNQVVIERHDDEEEPSPTRSAADQNYFSPEHTTIVSTEEDNSNLDVPSTTTPQPHIHDDWSPPILSSEHFYEELVKDELANDSVPEIGPVCRPKKKRAARKREEKKKALASMIFACKICDATFTNEFSLDAHIHQHLIWNAGSEENGSVAEKEEAVETKPNLIVLEGEYNSISGRGFFQCGICGKTFRNVGYIHIHLEKSHDVDAEQRIIAQGRQTEPAETAAAAAAKLAENRNYDVEEEMENRNLSPPTTTTELVETKSGAVHRCDDCHKAFDQLDLFLQHKVTHFRTFDCHYCKKTYTARKSLQNHILSTHPQGYSRISSNIDLTPETANSFS